MNYQLLRRDAFREKLRASCERYLNLSCENRLSIGIIKDGLTYVYRLNDNEDELRYDIGSVSKTMTAHVILKLHSEGKLNIKHSVADYIPLRKGSYPTVYELMTHTAGYGHLTPIELTLPRLIAHRYARKNPYENAVREDVIRCLERRNKKHKSYTYGYSDFAYAILAIVAENVTHTPFADILEGFIKNNLGLSDTSVTLDGKRVPPSVKSGHCIPFWRWQRDNPYIASGGVVSSLCDVMKYIKAELTSDEAYITMAHEICPESFSEKSKTGSCTGWHTYKKSNQLWHVGGVGTFRSSLIINKVKGIGVAVLGNAKGVSSANVHYIAKMLYSELKFKRIKLNNIYSGEIYEKENFKEEEDRASKES